MLKDLRTYCFFLAIAGLLGYSFVSCNRPSVKGKVLVTAVNDGLQVENYKSTGFNGVLAETSIIVIDPNKSSASGNNLTQEFYSACSPDVSYDAQKMLFAGQMNKGDTWQIYEMDLVDFNWKPLTKSPNNCSEPRYLPGGRIIFSQVLSEDSKDRSLMVLKQGQSDGGKITFGPTSYGGTEVLHDGRIISINQNSIKKADKNTIVVMRPDGTKELLFYKTEGTDQLIGRPKETQQGKILVIEQYQNGKTGLISLDYNNPLNSKKSLSNHLKGDVIGIGSAFQGNTLICYKDVNDKAFGLYEIDHNSSNGAKPLYKVDDLQLIDAVLIEERSRPKNIPSEVNMANQTGLLLCQDINFSGYERDDKLNPKQKAVKIEILGLQHSMGVVEAEADGSVYLKIKADTPFRIQTLDQENSVVSGPSTWMNLRPNERRACVGCHQGNELVPENRQPLSVLKDPIIIPQLEQLMATNR